jgi:hypothetical protein
VTWVVWNLVLVCLETVLVSVQDRCTVCTEHTIAIEIVFDTTRWDSLETRLKWNLGSVRLEIVQLLMQDWCVVCVERTVGSEIVLEAPDGSPR